MCRIEHSELHYYTAVYAWSCKVLIDTYSLRSPGVKIKLISLCTPKQYDESTLQSDTKILCVHGGSDFGAIADKDVLTIVHQLTKKGRHRQNMNDGP